MKKKELVDNGWKPKDCKIGVLYFKEDFFCRFKDEDTILVFSIKDDMNPLGEAKTLDDIFEIKKLYRKNKKYENFPEVTFRWNYATEAPTDFYKPVVYITKNNKIAVFKDTVSWTGGDAKDKTKHYSNWEWLREKYNIKYWVYQEDLLVDELYNNEND